MIGNISKSKGFKGDKGDVGDVKNLYFDIDENGDLYCTTEYVPSLKTAPYIGTDGHWYAFEPTTQKFYDTGVDARGEIPTEVIENYIDQQTADIKSNIESLNDRITTSAHFKGYFTYDDEITASVATPNDFAYSAESGTVWIYEDMGDGQYDWADSGKVIPTQAMQASDDLPLMNGEAKAGQSNEYSRSDHRHPTDETRLSVAKFEEFKNSLNDISNSSVFVVNFDTNNHTADKTYDEILAATKQYKTVMLYEGDRYLATLNSTQHTKGLVFETLDSGDRLIVTEYGCCIDSTWNVFTTTMLNEDVFYQKYNNLEKQLSDIDTALDNIIAKYGLDGDAS